MAAATRQQSDAKITHMFKNQNVQPNVLVKSRHVVNLVTFYKHTLFISIE